MQPVLDMLARPSKMGKTQPGQGNTISPCSFNPMCHDIWLSHSAREQCRDPYTQAGLAYT